MNFCPQCGQENHHLRITVGRLLVEVAKENLTVDTKAIRSIVPLTIRPGFLTLEFIRGKRASYNRPLRLYLFVSFVYFILTANVPGRDTADIAIENSDNLASPLSVSISQTPDSTTANTDDSDIFEFQSNEYLDANFPEAVAALRTTEGRGAFTTTLLDSVPIFLFLLIPLLGFWVYLLFYNKRYYYVDSFVFALHCQAAIFMGSIVVILFRLVWPSEWISILMFFLLFVYFVVAAKRVYDVSLFSALLRLLGVFVLHGLTAALALGVYMMYILVTFV